MPSTAERSGPQTRTRIAATAAGLFLARGFDAVTVADVAQEAGVSRATVMNHFPRKEDLFLDRAADAADLLRRTLRERTDGDPTAALRAALLRLADERSPLSGLGEDAVPFLRIIGTSPALTARTRELAADLQRLLVAELEADPAFVGDATLLAAFLVAGYGAVLAGTARRRLAGETVAVLEGDHRRRVERLFDALRTGVAPQA